MTPAISPELYGDLVAVASQPDFAEWAAMVRSTGGCAAPVHLYGESFTLHTATGELLASRKAGKLLVACGNRRRTRCPSCSEVYRADTFQLIKAGLVGGKDVPGTVTDHPKVFATFTAPSFGPVHHRVTRDDGRVERCHPHGPLSCRLLHRAGDPVLGQPIDPDNYDYVGAVLWNALSTRLWARTVQLANRHAARLLGIPQRRWPKVGRVSVAKVAEYQARGVVHFHAIMRLDGVEPGDPVPAGATVELLCEAIRAAAGAASVRPPNSKALGQPDPVVWGEQLDLRPALGQDADGEALTDGQVAGYLAKYATKGAETSGTVDRPIACSQCKGKGRHDVGDRMIPCDRCGGDGSPEKMRELSLPAHAKAMVDTCWRLGGLAELEDLRLRPWAHMLGFRGHFSTKSRRYSTTLGCLREARHRWRATRILTSQGLDTDTPVGRCKREDLSDFSGFDPDKESVLVVGDWSYIGRGHSLGQAIYAASIRQDLAEGRRIWHQVRHADYWETTA